MKKLSKSNKTKKFAAGGAPAAIPYRANTGVTRSYADDLARSAMRGMQDLQDAKAQQEQQQLNTIATGLQKVGKYQGGGKVCPAGYVRDFNTGRCIPVDPNQVTSSDMLMNNPSANTGIQGIPGGLPGLMYGNEGKTGTFGGYTDKPLQERLAQNAGNIDTSTATTGSVNPALYGVAGSAVDYGLNKITDDENEATVTKQEKFGNVAGSIASGAGQGAAMGAMFGPYGAAVGAGAGAVFGAVKGVKKNKEEERIAQDIHNKEKELGVALRESYMNQSMPVQTGFGYKSSTNMNMQPTNYFSAKTGGVRKVEGGVIKQIPGTDAVKFIGRSHAQGGIKVDPKTEVEGGETQDQVYMNNNAKQDYIYSKYLKLGGKSFAKRHEEILKSNMSAVQKQNAMQDLAKMQEQKAGRDPQQIAKMGGVRRYLNGGPEDCLPGEQVWSEEQQKCVWLEVTMPEDYDPDNKNIDIKKDNAIFDPFWEVGSGKGRWTHRPAQWVDYSDSGIEKGYRAEDLQNIWDPKEREKIRNLGYARGKYIKYVPKSTKGPILDEHPGQGLPNEINIDPHARGLEMRYEINGPSRSQREQGIAHVLNKYTWVDGNMTITPIATSSDKKRDVKKFYEQAYQLIDNLDRKAFSKEVGDTNPNYASYETPSRYNVSPGSTSLEESGNYSTPNRSTPDKSTPDEYRIFQNAEGDYILRDANNNEITRSKDLNTVYQAKGRLVNKGFFQNKDNTITEPTKVETVADLNTPIDQQIVSQDPNTGVYSITDRSGNEIFSSGDINDVLTYNRDQAAKNTPSEEPVQSKIQNDTVDIDFSKFTAEKAAEELNKVYNVDNGGVVPADIIEAYTNYYSSQEAKPAANTTNTTNTIPTVADLNTPLTTQGSADAQSNTDAQNVTMRDQNKANSNAPSDQDVVTEGSNTNDSGLNFSQNSDERPRREGEPAFFFGAKRNSGVLKGHGALANSVMGAKMSEEELSNRVANSYETAAWRKEDNNYSDNPSDANALPSSNAIKDRDKIAETKWGEYFGYKKGMSAEEAKTAHENYATQANDLFTNNPDYVLGYFQYMIDEAGDKWVEDINSEFYGMPTYKTGLEAERIKNHLKSKGYIGADGKILSSALPYLQKQATNESVGPIHNAMAYLTSIKQNDVVDIQQPDKPKVQEEPVIEEKKTYTPPTACPPNTFRNPTTGACEPLPGFKAQTRYEGIVPQLAQLVPVGYSMLNPYKITPGVGPIGVASRTILPRVNYNQDKAFLIDQNVALRNAVTSQNAGPGALSAMMAAGTQAAKNQLAISQSESEANKQLAAEEARLNLQASMANQEMGLKRDMFNREFFDKQRNYKREEILGALDAAAERTAGIYKDNKLFAAQERLAKALDETGSYDRFTIYEELKKQSKEKDSPYYGKTDVELRAMAASYATSIYGDLDYYRYVADKEGKGSKEGDKEGDKAKLGGVRKYTSRLGELSGGRKRFNI